MNTISSDRTQATLDLTHHDGQRDGLLSDPRWPQPQDASFYFDSCLHAGLAQVLASSSRRRVESTS